MGMPNVAAPVRMVRRIKRFDAGSRGAAPPARELSGRRSVKRLVTTTPLTQLRLDLPCQVPWETMDAVDADGHVRYCGQCQLNVHNLSAMTADEARAFLARQPQRVCVSFRRAQDGTVLTLDYQPAAPPGRRRWQKAAVAAAVVTAAGGAVAVSQRGGALPPLLGGTVAVAGGICAAPPAPYSPFAPAGTTPVNPPGVVAASVKNDRSLSQVAAALPAGVEVLDVRYGVHPPGMFAEWGQCVVVGKRPAVETEPASARAAPLAVVWRMRPGYGDASHVSPQPDPAHPLRRVATTAEHDVLVWSDDAELERVIEAAVQTPTTPPGAGPSAAAVIGQNE